MGHDLSALDIYLLVSLLFIFGTMIEFAFVLLFHRRIKPYMGSNRVYVYDEANFESLKENKTKQAIHNQKLDINDNSLFICPFLIFKRLELPTKIDFLTFVIYNLSYLIFNIIYFSIYLNNQQEWYYQILFLDLFFPNNMINTNLKKNISVQYINV